MQAANILPYEAVHIWNVTRGTRLMTYALEGPAGSRAICVNGGSSQSSRHCSRLAKPAHVRYVMGMAHAARTMPTFEELYRQIEALPPGMTGEVLEPGVLRVMSRPGGRHRFAARRLVPSLSGSDLAEGGSGWWFEVEAEIRFPQGLLAVPDLSAWRTSGVPSFIETNPIEVIPDFCCEILSPSSARDDRRLKLPLYARAAVSWCWVVDPELRLVEVYETLDGVPALRCAAKDDDVVVLPPFEHEVSVGRWWLELPSQSEGK